ncbi:MAG TPA: hypothetical protein VLG38_05020, partial [Gammaproteobacteria bacterium]|nr:hypothetical protein [Gammaproteobacteria bacterium]
MKLNLTLLDLLLKAYNIKGQGYSHHLANNSEVVQDYIRAINRHEMAAPVGPIRVWIANAIGALLAVGRLIGIERALQALYMLQSFYGHVVIVNFSIYSCPIQDDNNFHDIMIPVVSRSNLDLESIAGTILWFCDDRCR